LRPLLTKKNKMILLGNDSFTAWRNEVVEVIAADLESGRVEAMPDGPLRLEVEFRFVRPKSHTRKQRNIDLGWRDTGSDLDKLIRALGDSLTVAGQIGDDRQIVQIVASKFYVVAGDPTSPSPGMGFEVSRVVLPAPLML
jgi:Holliday junction resolvase RusA-like endonuclease